VVKVASRVVHGDHTLRRRDQQRQHCQHTPAQGPWISNYQH